MKLVVQPSTAADFEVGKSIYGPEKGEISSAAVLAAWNLDASDPTASQRRAQWSCQQQKEILENDPSIRPVKVVDADSNDAIVAVGRWHRYTEGYQHVADLEAVGLKDRNDPKTWPEGLNKAFYLGLLDPLFAKRTEWMGTGHYWSKSPAYRQLFTSVHRKPTDACQSLRTSPPASRCGV